MTIKALLKEFDELGFINQAKIVETKDFIKWVYHQGETNTLNTCKQRVNTSKDILAELDKYKCGKHKRLRKLLKEDYVRSIKIRV